MATQRSTAMAQPNSKGHKPKNTILAPKIWQNFLLGSQTCFWNCRPTCRYKAKAPGITWPPRSVKSRATVSSKNGALDWRLRWTRARMPRAVRLEMAPNVRVKHVIPKPDGLMGSQVLLFSQGLDPSEELIFRCRLDSTEELDNGVTVVDSVLMLAELCKE